MPYDISTIALRCMGSGIVLGMVAGTVLAFTDGVGLGGLIFWSLIAATASLFTVGGGLGKYVVSAERYYKMLQGDLWVYAVKRARADYLAARQTELELHIADLRADFAAEKAALEDLREERIAQERMAGFIDGVSKSPEMMAYLSNPRNRLRIVPDSEEKSA
ncbi:hypothetical protein OHB41_34180 [Streptomyces sp. NBC_01571]|uniref:hypothetical protein n=1 Tax=Streptomyces sp. NBC_01571 TaxID=2975883 RepID=UPI00224EA6B1|nr:hypothetical protein [Streptomyces sp. NBC_01571]MCX4578152.1 hypothetical protein [Streptomyces sp. NBC_01571]